MQNSTIINLVDLPADNATIYLITKTIMLGLITFGFFFLLMRTLDKNAYSKTMFRALRQKWDIIKHGNAIMLVKDGVLQLDKLYLSNITPQQIYAALRRKRIQHIGEVERLFLIPGGEFSIYIKQDINDGLPMIEHTRKEFLDAQGEI